MTDNKKQAPKPEPTKAKIMAAAAEGNYDLVKQLLAQMEAAKEQKKVEVKKIEVKKVPEKQPAKPAKKEEKKPEELFGKEDVKKPFSHDDMVAEYAAGGEQALQNYLRIYFACILSPTVWLMYSPGMSPIVITSKDILARQLGLVNPMGKIYAAAGHEIMPLALINKWKAMQLTSHPYKYRMYYDESTQRHCINQFGGWLHMPGGWTPVSKEEKCSVEDRKLIEPFLNHIKLVLSRGKQDRYDRIVRWLARITQGYRNEECGICVVGEPGTGKSTVFEFIGEYVFGMNATFQTNNADSVVGTYNAQIEGKPLIFLEEAPANNKNERKHNGEGFKNLITAKVVEVADKHVKARSVRNFANIVLATNHETALSLDNNDRRWFIIEVSTCMLRNFPYFTTLHPTGDKAKQIGAAFWRYFRTMDVESFNEQDRHVPVTEEKARLTMPIVARWIKEKYIEKALGIEKIRFGEFCEQFRKWFAEQRDFRSLHTYNKKKFSKELMTVVPGIVKKMRFNDDTAVGVEARSLGELNKWFLEKRWLDPEVDDIYNEDDAIALQQRETNARDGEALMEVYGSATRPAFKRAEHKAADMHKPIAPKATAKAAVPKATPKTAREIESDKLIAKVKELAKSRRNTAENVAVPIK